MCIRPGGGSSKLIHHLCNDSQRHIDRVIGYRVTQPFILRRVVTCNRVYVQLRIVFHFFHPFPNPHLCKMRPALLEIATEIQQKQGSNFQYSIGNFMYAHITPTENETRWPQSIFFLNKNLQTPFCVSERWRWMGWTFMMNETPRLCCKAIRNNLSNAWDLRGGSWINRRSLDKCCV